MFDIFIKLKSQFQQQQSYNYASNKWNKIDSARKTLIFIVTQTTVYSSSWTSIQIFIIKLRSS